MQIEVGGGAWAEIEADWLVAGVVQSEELTAELSALDESLGGTVSRLRESGDLPEKPGDAVLLPDAPGVAAGRVLLVGLGPAGDLTVAKLEKALLSAARRASKKAAVSVAVALPNLADSPVPDDRAAQVAAISLSIGCVGQSLYRSEPARFAFTAATIIPPATADAASIQAAVAAGVVLGDAVNLTRELVNRTAEEVYPESFADRAAQAANEFGLECDILDENRLREERMGSLLAVGLGSVRPPRVVVLTHRGAGDGAPVLAIVGKGVTFDSGGLSLKTNEGMKTMKCDMAGAATMLGAMTAIARLELPLNVIGLAGLVENMPSGNAFKLGDVLPARNGTTIEVLNTDAEGRLVLADVLAYAVDAGAERLIDLATLTGACVVALGEDVTGAFTNDQAWCDDVLAAADRAGEPAWQMPMFELYNDLIKSDVADIKNIGSRWGGAITAAKFLERFVDDTPWVHLDIAGPSFASSNKPYREGGGTGCMVRTLVDVAAALADSD